jgi:hypothetical protein
MLHGKHFSGDEMDALRAMLKGEPNKLEGRRRREFDSKLGLS